MSTNTSIAADDLATLKTMALDYIEQGSTGHAIRVLCEAGMTLADALKLAYPVRPAIGHVLTSSWGYDQTNIDFYLVTKVSASSVWLQRCGATVQVGDGTDALMPDTSRVIEEKAHVHRFRMDKDGQSYSVTLSKRGGYASLWDGKPEHQTSSGYGH